MNKPDNTPVTGFARLRRVVWILLRPWVWALAVLGGLAIGIPREDPFMFVVVAEGDRSVTARPIHLEIVSRYWPLLDSPPKYHGALVEVGWYGEEIPQTDLEQAASIDPDEIFGNSSIGAVYRRGWDELLGAEYGGELDAHHYYHQISISVLWLAGLPLLASVLGVAYAAHNGFPSSRSISRSLIRPWLFGAALIGLTIVLFQSLASMESQSFRATVWETLDAIRDSDGSLSVDPNGLWPRELALEWRGPITDLSDEEYDALSALSAEQDLSSVSRYTIYDSFPGLDFSAGRMIEGGWSCLGGGGTWSR
ncbi:MAG: hypothetical protein AAF907_15555, partial [Planctomycetota bacterium]